MFKEWLSVRNAAQKFGYCNQESLRRRLRQLRKRGFIVDVGEPPSKYVKERNKHTNQSKIYLYWSSPTTMFIRADAPKHFLNSKRGKRSKKQEHDFLE